MLYMTNLSDVDKHLHKSFDSDRRQEKQAQWHSHF